MSLDGYIAGPNGEIDWIIADPSVDFGAIYADFDAALLGRRTYELTQQHKDDVLLAFGRPRIQGD